MLQYLVVLLDYSSVSYCHYENSKKARRLISLEDLKAGILFGMKENLQIQFVYPDYELTDAYRQAIEMIDHTNIKPAACAKDADVVVFNGFDEFLNYSIDKNATYVLRTSKQALFENYQKIDKCLAEVARLNIVLTDLESFTETDFTQYKKILLDLTVTIASVYGQGKTPQINVLTDRMMLDTMNNCNAGWKNITLAPDGKFYVCPAFYLCDDGYSIGSLSEGLDIKNPQLYKLSYAPLCRKCDAYQCKRCIYLNRKTTKEVNTPSHEQCVAAHLERNASRDLLAEIRKLGVFLPDNEIKEISYLDPFEIKDER